jgi:hypothetical protein
MYPLYLGVVLHLKRTYVVLMDSEGDVIDERRMPNAEMAGYFEQHVPQETYQCWKPPVIGHSCMIC